MPPSTTTKSTPIKNCWRWARPTLDRARLNLRAGFGNCRRPDVDRAGVVEVVHYGVVPGDRVVRRLHLSDDVCRCGVRDGRAPHLSVNPRGGGCSHFTGQREENGLGSLYDDYSARFRAASRSAAEWALPRAGTLPQRGYDRAESE